MAQIPRAGGWLLTYDVRHPCSDATVFWEKRAQRHGVEGMLRFVAAWADVLYLWAAKNMPPCEALEVARSLVGPYQVQDFVGEHWNLFNGEILASDRAALIKGWTLQTDWHNGIAFLYHLLRVMSRLVVDHPSIRMRLPTGGCLHLQHAVYLMNLPDLWELSDKVFLMHHV